MGCNKLREECYRFKEDLDKPEIPAEFNFDDAFWEQRILYERESKKEKKDTDENIL